MAAAAWRGGNKGAKGGKGGKGGKGQQKGGWKGPDPQAMEWHFNEQANAFFSDLFNWNRPTQSLDGGWKELLNARNQVLSAYGCAPAAAGGSANTAAGGEVNYKSELYHAFGKAQGRSVTKQDFTFEVEEQAEGNAKSYICKLTCAEFAQEYQGEAPAVSKKQAEHWAAAAALKAEYPDVYARISHGAPAVAAGNGKKRKAGEMAGPTEAKSRLHQAAQLLVGQALKQGDIVYESEPVADSIGQFVGTVTLAAYDNTVGYQGLPAAGKKEAEQAAAEAALQALADKLKPLQDEHEAKRKAKAVESLQKLKESREAKKAKTGGETDN